MNWKLRVCTNLSTIGGICVVFVEGLSVDVFVQKILRQLVLICTTTTTASERNYGCEDDTVRVTLNEGIGLRPLSTLNREMF